jgi:hypothetical protein
MSEWILQRNRSGITYLSLNPLAAPPFPVTEMTASSKFHDEAAVAMPEPRTSSEGINERRNRIVEVVVRNVRILELGAAYLNY